MQMVEKNPMEINTQKEDISVEEQVMKQFLLKWRHLDEHFIPEDQKKLYKETFQQYKVKQGNAIIAQPKHLGSQGREGKELVTLGKRGNKQGRRPMNESIHIVGELLLNLGRVVPLSEVFQQPPKFLK